MKIGLIAGNGQFPILFLKAAREKGYTVFVAAIKNETDTAVSEYAEETEWLHLGQLKRLIRFFKKHHVKEVVMLGGINKTRIFSDIKPDMKAVMLLAGMKHTHDDGVLGVFARFLEKEDVRVRSSTFLMPEILATPGCWTKTKPTRAQNEDIRTGWKLVKEIGRLDIGQCIVMGGGSVLAVEAIDGTDATIKRGGLLGKGDAIVIKVSKPNQDMRFDVPAVGLKTIETMYDAGARVLVIEAGKAVVFNRDEMVAFADSKKISILAMD